MLCLDYCEKIISIFGKEPLISKVKNRISYVNLCTYEPMCLCGEKNQYPVVWSLQLQTCMIHTFIWKTLFPLTLQCIVMKVQTSEKAACWRWWKAGCVLNPRLEMN